MKKILFIPSTTSGGVYFYRAYMPMKQLTLQYPEDFDITINSSLSFTESDCEYAAGFDIVIVHNGLFSAEAQEKQSARHRTRVSRIRVKIFILFSSDMLHSGRAPADYHMIILSYRESF